MRESSAKGTWNNSGWVMEGGGGREEKERRIGQEKGREEKGEGARRPKRMHGQMAGLYKNEKLGKGKPSPFPHMALNFFDEVLWIKQLSQQYADNYGSTRSVSLQEEHQNNCSLRKSQVRTPKYSVCRSEGGSQLKSALPKTQILTYSLQNCK